MTISDKRREASGCIPVTAYTILRTTLSTNTTARLVLEQLVARYITYLRMKAVFIKLVMNGQTTIC